MNIIFGDTVKQVADIHTVLELDTFKLIPSDRLVTSYCVIDNLPLAEFPQLEANKKIHHQLMEQYRQKNWDFCRSALHSLKGYWNGEMDTFYQHLLERITKFQDAPDNNWNYWIVKYSD